MKNPKAVPPGQGRTHAFGVTQAALEAIKGKKSLVQLAGIYNVCPNTIGKWKAELVGYALRA
jgi:transposase